VTVTIEELVVDRGEDVAEAVRAQLESAPAQGAPFDAGRVAAAVASAVDANVESS
jgi:hypothetical protein